jgi:hypothetical protein
MRTYLYIHLLSFTHIPCTQAQQKHYFVNFGCVYVCIQNTSRGGNLRFTAVHFNKNLKSGKSVEFDVASFCASRTFGTSCSTKLRNGALRCTNKIGWISSIAWQGSPTQTFLPQGIVNFLMYVRMYVNT